MASQESTYFARIQFGKVNPDGTEKLYFSAEYPSLDYGGMVGVEALAKENLLSPLVALGVEAAHAIGQVVPGVDALPGADVPPGQAKK